MKITRNVSPHPKEISVFSINRKIYFQVKQHQIIGRFCRFNISLQVLERLIHAGNKQWESEEKFNCMKLNNIKAEIS
jgi:hypothetical protein